MDERSPLLSWVERHPKAMLYLLVMTTLNFLLSLLTTTHVL